MFDDSKLKKFKDPSPRIFEKLPVLRPHSRPFLKRIPNIPNPEIFSEISAINKLKFPNPDIKIPFTQRVSNNFIQRSKIRSVSFLDFSEALTSVSKIAHLEEQFNANKNYGILLKKMMYNPVVSRKSNENNNSFNKKKKRKIETNSLDKYKKEDFSIFDYPNIFINSCVPSKKNYEFKQKIAIIDDLNKIQENSKPLHEIRPQNIRKIRKSCHIFNEAKKTPTNNNKPIRISRENNNPPKKRPVINRETKSQLFSKFSEKIPKKARNSSQNQDREIRAKNENNNNFQKEFEERTSIEPWNIQDSFAEEIL